MVGKGRLAIMVYQHRGQIESGCYVRTGKRKQETGNEIPIAIAVL
jgi:hypothetical protein